MLLSIIVPIYNVQKYLSKCIESILEQTFKDFELILINDGSSDRSGEICDKYANQDPRIRVIHKKNGGQSSARNAGLEIAIGKYISFVDADDTLSLDTYSKNIDILLKDETIDFLRFPLVFVDEENGKITHEILENKHIRDKKEAFTIWSEYGKGARGYVCENIYKRSLFDKLRFKEGILYEDSYIQGFILEQINHIYISKEGRYYYLQRQGSTTNSPLTLNKVIGDLEATAIFMEKMETYKVDIKYIIFCYNRTIGRGLTLCKSFPKVDLSDYFNRMNSLNISCYDILKSEIPLKNKLRNICIKTIGLKLFLQLKENIIQK